MTIISNVLFLVANALLLPVILILIGLFVHALLSLGGFYGLHLRRVKEQRRIEELFATWLAHGAAAAAGTDFSPSSLFGHYLGRLREVEFRTIHAEKILADAQDEVESLLARHRLAMRLGPMLGLMGTLIPLGPALSNLAAGAIAEMALHLQIAFSTTVVGVLVGGVGLLVYTNQRRWFYRDLAHLEQLVMLHAASASAP